LGLFVTSFSQFGELFTDLSTIIAIFFEIIIDNATLGNKFKKFIQTFLIENFTKS
jgi:hypothetical protein